MSQRQRDLGQKHLSGSARRDI